MYGPESLLQMIGGEKIRYPSKLIQKPILVTEHGRGTDDGRLGKDAADDFLPTGFGAKELRGRILARIVGGDVDETVNIIFGNSFGDALSALDMNIFKRKVPFICQLEHHWEERGPDEQTLSGNHVLRDCRQHRNGVRSLRVKQCFGGHIPSQIRQPVAEGREYC